MKKLWPYFLTLFLLAGFCAWLRNRDLGEKDTLIENQRDLIASLSARNQRLSNQVVFLQQINDSLTGKNDDRESENMLLDVRIAKIILDWNLRESKRLYEQAFQNEREVQRITRELNK